MSKCIALVACVGKKAAVPKPARELYISAWFDKASTYAQQVADSWFILSAKYGLIAPNEIIAPYDETLNRMPSKECRAWAKRVLTSLKNKLHPRDHVIILAGRRYREYLIEPLSDFGCEVEVPMAGLRIGEQLRWLNQQLREANAQ